MLRLTRLMNRCTSQRLRHAFSPRIRHLVLRSLQYPEAIPYELAAKGIVRNDNHRSILELRGKHRGERCFIIGLGPSLNLMDISPLRDEITFSFNGYFLGMERFGFLPTYYLVEDRVAVDRWREPLNALEGTTKILRSSLRTWLGPGSDRMYVFVNHYYDNYPYSGAPRFSEDVLRCTYWGGTVAYMSLQIAYYMGIREVYLIGIDLNYESRDAPHHFHPEYTAPGSPTSHPVVSRPFVVASRFFQEHGGKVCNATVGGNLRGVPRVSYDDVVHPGRWVPDRHHTANPQSVDKVKGFC